MTFFRRCRWLGIAFGCMCCGIVLYSCTTAVTNVELPHSERLVVTGFLVAGEGVKNIQVSKTLAPLDTFSYSRVYVGDARVTLTVDGVTTQLRLRTRQPGDTLPNGTPGALRSLYEAPETIVQSGKIYALRVEWNGKVATAQTLVPAPPVVQSSAMRFGLATIVSTNASLLTTASTTLVQFGPRMPGQSTTGIVQVTQGTSTAVGIARTGEMYRIQSVWYYDPAKRDSSGGDVDPALDLAFSARILGAGSTVLMRQNTNILRISVSTRTYGLVTVQAADELYYDYIVTNSRAQAGGGSFLGSEGINPKWNVGGDGIGIFIGTAKTIVRIQ
jgi:Domain of unknown function (DUF4249)